MKKTMFLLSALTLLLFVYALVTFDFNLDRTIAAAEQPQDYYQDAAGENESEMFGCIGESEDEGILDAIDPCSLVEAGHEYEEESINSAPCTAELDEYLQNYGNSVAVFYMDIQSGFTYMFNPDRVFFSASINKAKHALYLYHLAEQGLLNMSRVHTYTEYDHWEGTGRIQDMEFGSTFTTRELLRRSIRDSDNIAFRMLIRSYGLRGYMDFVREIGADESLIRNITGSNSTARDAGLWAYAIYQYLISDGAYAQTFKTDLLNTLTIIRADYPIASKYGWATNAFHDMGIVFADSPYILVILSDMYQNNGAFAPFSRISRKVEEFHRRYFAEAADGRS